MTGRKSEDPVGTNDPGAKMVNCAFYPSTGRCKSTLARSLTSNSTDGPSVLANWLTALLTSDNAGARLSIR